MERLHGKVGEEEERQKLEGVERAIEKDVEKEFQGGILT